MGLHVMMCLETAFDSRLAPAHICLQEILNVVTGARHKVECHHCCSGEHILRPQTGDGRYILNLKQAKRVPILGLLKACSKTREFHANRCEQEPIVVSEQLELKLEHIIRLKPVSSCPQILACVAQKASAG